MKKLLCMIAMAILGAALPAMAVTWETVYPTGGTASKISFVQVKCTEVAYRYTADDATASLYDASDILVKTLVRNDINITFKGSYCLVEFTFTPALTEPGTYRLDVPKGTFTTTAGDECEAFSVTLKVETASYENVDPNFTCRMPEGGKGALLDYILLGSTYNWDMVNEGASGAIYDSTLSEVATLTNENIFSYDGAVMVVLSPAITTPGSYMLIINEGSLVSTASNATNAMAMVELTVVQAQEEPTFDVVATPENGASVSSEIGISAIFLSINGYKFASGNADGITASIEKDGKAYATFGASAISAGMDRTSAVIALPEEAQMLTAGNYTVSLPKGFFIVKAAGDSEETFESPAITLNYTITTPAQPISWTISPAPGEVDEVSAVTITFNKPVEAAVSKYVNFFYTNYSYLPETVSEGILSISDDGLTATVNFNPALAIGGIFQMRIFEGQEQLKVADGEEFPGLNATYKVNAPLYAEWVPAADSEVSKLDEVKVLLRYNTNISAAESFSACFKNGEKQVKAELVKVVPYDFEPAYVVVKAAEPITEAGTWELVIAEGSIAISNYGETMASPQIAAKFTVDGTMGIADIFAEGNKTIDVYNLQGVRILTNATQSQVSTLPAGLYIAGSHKVRIR